MTHRMKSSKIDAIKRVSCRIYYNAKKEIIK